MFDVFFANENDMKIDKVNDNGQSFYTVFN